MSSARVLFSSNWTYNWPFIKLSNNLTKVLVAGLGNSSYWVNMYNLDFKNKNYSNIVFPSLPPQIGDSLRV